MEKTNEQIAMRVAWNAIWWNVALSIFKLAAGIVGRSAAMVSDSVHSMSDVLSTFVVMVGVRLANKKADKEHPYGHDRFECVTAILLAFILCITGLGIGYAGLQRVFSGDYSSIAIPSLLPLITAVLSIVVKEAMYWYTRAAARRIRSGALMADAWHHRSDALSSVGSFVGILGARIGYPVLDSIASLVISIFIVKASYDIFADAVSKLTDRACDDKTVEQIRAVALRHPDVMGVDLLHTRLFGDKIYIDIEISVDGAASLYESHDIAHRVHDAIEGEFPHVKHCMVHLNPSNPPSPPAQ